jgi:hypothetical protein
LLGGATPPPKQGKDYEKAPHDIAGAVRAILNEQAGAVRAVLEKWSAARAMTAKAKTPTAPAEARAPVRPMGGHHPSQ